MIKNFENKMEKMQESINKDLEELKNKLENNTKARCQLEDKAMKIKLINMLRGKKRKKRKTRYAKLNRGR